MKALIVLALVLVPFAAFADIAATGVQKTGGCVEFTLCDAEGDTTAACDKVDATGAGNISADLTGRDSHIACLDGSTATSISCNLYTSSSGYHATARSAAILASALTETNYCAPISGQLRKTWAECATISGGGAAVTLKILSCPASR